MKKLFAYLLCLVATFGMCWCGIISISMPYGNERAPYAFGACIGFLIALLCAGWGNSLTWEGQRKERQ